MQRRKDRRIGTHTNGQSGNDDQSQRRCPSPMINAITMLLNTCALRPSPPFSGLQPSRYVARISSP